MGNARKPRAAAPAEETPAETPADVEVSAPWVRFELAELDDGVPVTRVELNLPEMDEPLVLEAPFATNDPAAIRALDENPYVRRAEA